MNILDLVKNVVSQEIESVGLKLEGIVLFGSRARGDYRENSDWDFLVLVNKDLSPIENCKLRARMVAVLVRKGIDCEIILKSKKAYDIDRKIVNTISYSASLEGVEI